MPQTIDSPFCGVVCVSTCVSTNIGGCGALCMTLLGGGCVPQMAGLLASASLRMSTTAVDGSSFVTFGGSGPIDGPMDGPLGGPIDGSFVGPLDGPIGPLVGDPMDVPPIVRVRFFLFLIWRLQLSDSEIVFRFLANACSCRCNIFINAGMGCASGLRRFTNVKASSKVSSIFLCMSKKENRHSIMSSKGTRHFVSDVEQQHVPNAEYQHTNNLFFHSTNLFSFNKLTRNAPHEIQDDTRGGSRHSMIAMDQDGSVMKSFGNKVDNILGLRLQFGGTGRGIINGHPLVHELFRLFKVIGNSSLMDGWMDNWMDG